MKKLLLNVLVAALVVCTSQAQEIKDREPRKHQMPDHHHRGQEWKSLNLTEEQKAKFKALQEENRQQREELQKKDNLTVKEWRSKMEAQQKEYRSKLQSLLTDEQKTQLEKSRQDRKNQSRERSIARAERMKTELALSDEQSAKLKNNREAMIEKIKAIRENNELTDDSKREQVRELIRQQRQEMRSMLTEEQLKHWEEIKKQRPNRKKIV